MAHTPDAIVIGSGPNGLAAAITIAQAGRTVTVYEADAAAGGGMRSAALTLPGFVHDVCSAIQPFAPISRAFRSLPLARHGLDWIRPPVMFAHPLDDGRAAAVVHDVDETARSLGVDARAYRNLIGPVVDAWERLEPALLGPPRASLARSSGISECRLRCRRRVPRGRRRSRRPRLAARAGSWRRSRGAPRG